MQRHSHWPITIHWKRILSVFLGVTLAVGLAGMLTDLTHCFILVTSLGASSLLLLGFPDSAFSQPRNFLGGSFISALIGLIFIHFIGTQWWAVAAATGLATAVMMMTDTIHPPAASNPLIIYSLHAHWSFLLFPNLSGNIVILRVALLYHRFTRKERYPHYWI
jgi:CBS-domain-containing membrane protein